MGPRVSVRGCASVRFCLFCADGASSPVRGVNFHQVRFVFVTYEIIHHV